MRDADASGRPRGRPGTASAEQQLRSPSLCGIGPELERHRDTSAPALALEQRGDGAVDAAADGDEDALAARRRAASGSAPRRPHRGAERAVQRRRRRARRRGRRPALRPPSSAAIAAASSSAASCEARAVEQLGRGGRGGAGPPRSPRLEADVGDPAVLEPQRDRDQSPQARPAGRCRRRESRRDSGSPSDGEPSSSVGVELAPDCSPVPLRVPGAAARSCAQAVHLAARGRAAYG